MRLDRLPDMISARRIAARLLVGTGLAVAGAAAAQLPGPVAEALRAAGVPPEQAAVLVQEVGAPRPWLQQNTEQPLNPGSVMKLVVTYAALEQLGTAYRWRTEVYFWGSPAGGVVNGPLFLKGYGDPKLTLESFWLLLRGLRERGVRELRGDLFLDRSHFAVPAHDPAAFDGGGFRPYNVGPDALLVNFKTIRFLFAAGEGDALQILTQPHPQGLEVVNALRPVEGPCGRWREQVFVEYKPVPGGLRVIFAGPYPRSCGEQAWLASLYTPNEYAGAVFRQLWEELGGSWSGSVQEGVVPAGTPLVLSHPSAPLAKVVRDINKFSNNVMARHLYLTLGAVSAGPPARAEAAYQAVRTALSRRGLDMPELVIENGSGLSRIERISARSLGRLLLDAYAGPYMPEFMASLPLVAVDGTMQRRLKGVPVAGHAHIKTGSLADTRALAGYVLDRSGARHAVVMIVNHPAAGRTQAAQDALLTWVYGRGRP